MSDETDFLPERKSNALPILLLVAALPALALALNAIAGAVVAAAACAIYVTALALTIHSERNDDTPSRDPLTGLPDRAAAIDRLERIFEQRLTGTSQAGVFVISVARPDGETHPIEGAPLAVIAIAKLAQGLRRGDQIIRIGDNTLAAILGPSRGLTARAAEGILDRIESMFGEPLRIGPHVVPIRVSLGACLQHDAPRADAASWLEAAELAAIVASEDGMPRLFPSGATKVDRSAWDDAVPPISDDRAEEDRWNTAAQRRSDDPAKARFDVDRRRA